MSLMAARLQEGLRSSQQPTLYVTSREAISIYLLSVENQGLRKNHKALVVYQNYIRLTISRGVRNNQITIHRHGSETAVALKEGETQSSFEAVPNKFNPKSHKLNIMGHWELKKMKKISAYKAHAKLL